MTSSHRIRRRNRSAALLTAGVAILMACGCSNRVLWKSAQPQPLSLTPPPGVAAPAASLPASSAVAPPPSFADVDARQLQGTLARSQDENQLLRDEIAVLREQLMSTSGQLAAARSPGNAGFGTVPGTVGWATLGAGADGSTEGGSRQAAASLAKARMRQGVVGPAAMQAALAELAVAGVDARFDGHVVRLEVPADRLFDDGGAALLPGGTALLTEIAAEVDRLFPRHFLGIEGHLDTEPLERTTWRTPHELTAARAAAVFDFFTTRTPLRQGQLFLVAHGGNHPVVSNATAAGRIRNRRMELVIYPERIGPGDDTAQGTP